MNLLFTSLYAGSRGGGIPPVMRALAEAWKQRGPRVRIQTLDRDPVDDLESFGGFPPVVRIPEFWPRMGFGRGWGKALRQTDPDLVHAHGLWCGLSRQTARTCQSMEIPWIVSPHGMLAPGALGISRWKKNISYPLLESGHLTGARTLHALNRDELRDIRNFGLKNPVAIIPNGVEIPSTGSLMREPDSGDAPKKLLFLGRIHPKKGLKGFLQTWKQALPKGWILQITGIDDGGHRRDLEDWVRQNRLQDAVHFHGPVHGAKKERAYLDADAFVLPSQSEGQPMAVLEAWSYGLPVLMTRACNLPEGFEAGAAAELPGETNTRTEVLKAFLDKSPSEMKAMGESGRALVEHEFTWDAAAEKYQLLYQWVLNRGPKPEFVVEE